MNIFSQLLAIYSPSFLESPRNGFLMALADFVSIVEKPNFIIPIILRPCDSLPPTIRMRSKLPYDPDRKINFYERLLRDTFRVRFVIVRLLSLHESNPFLLSKVDGVTEEMKEYPDCFKACKDPNSKIVHSRPVRPTTPSSPSDPSAPALPAGSIALRPVEAVNSAFEDSLCLSSSISRYEGDFTDLATVSTTLSDLENGTVTSRLSTDTADSDLRLVSAAPSVPRGDEVDLNAGRKSSKAMGLFSQVKKTFTKKSKEKYLAM